MNVDLPLNGFAVSKVVSSSAFLVAVLAFPIVSVYAFAVAVIIGRAHGFGAWIGMWRAGKLNRTYVALMTIVTVLVAYWGFRVAPIDILRLLTYLSFSFHFFFDEFDLQDEERRLDNAVQGVGLFTIITTYVLATFFTLPFGFDVYLALAGVFLLLELMFLKKITWLFVQMKLFLVFILTGIYFGVPDGALILTLLISHYFFWFVYPVYKLHKYRPEERDNFIMIMVLLIAWSSFFAFAQGDSGIISDAASRMFYVGTLIHVLSTAPFGYLFGLPLHSPQRPHPPASA